jgi:hypothetical protein
MTAIEAAALAIYRSLSSAKPRPWLASFRRLLDSQPFVDCFAKFYVECGPPLSQARERAREAVKHLDDDSGDWRRALI